MELTEGEGQMPVQRYYTILNEYERRLDQRVQIGEIQEMTKETYLQDANRIFEALISVFPKEVIAAIVALRFEGPYGHIIDALEEIAAEREGHRSR
jgi:RNA binding exosome subunit